MVAVFCVAERATLAQDVDSAVELVAGVEVGAAFEVVESVADVGLGRELVAVFFGERPDGFVGVVLRVTWDGLKGDFETPYELAGFVAVDAAGDERLRDARDGE